MWYYGVGNRCAVDLSTLELPISDAQALDILTQAGYRILDVNVVELGRACIKKSQYKRGSSPVAAPTTVDCSSLTQWLYAQRGVMLPRYSIDQRDSCGKEVSYEDIGEGDLVFTSGYRNYYWSDATDGVGHVGIATAQRTVIHAASVRRGVTETPLRSFAGKDTFRGARRIVADPQHTLTIHCPHGRPVLWSRSFKWIISQRL